MARLHHVLVLGGTGFVGRHVVPRLSAAGHRVTVIARRRHEARHLILLPTVEVVEGDPLDPRELDARMRGVTARREPGRHPQRACGAQTFASVHVEVRAQGRRRLHARRRRAPRAHERAQRRSGGAEPLPALERRGGGDRRGVGARLDDLPAVGDLRPRGPIPEPVRAAAARCFPLLALASPDAKFAPVYVGDVAHCFAHALDDDATIGQRYDLCGPNVYTLRAARPLRRRADRPRRPIVRLGPALSRLQARLLELVPGTPMSRDNLASMAARHRLRRDRSRRSSASRPPRSRRRRRRGSTARERPQPLRSRCARRAQPLTAGMTRPAPAAVARLPRRRLGARRAARPSGRRPRLGGRRRDAGDAGGVRVPRRRPRLSGVPASRNEARNTRSRAPSASTAAAIAASSSSRRPT